VGSPAREFIRFEPAALPVCSARGGVRTRPSAPFQRADTFARMTKPLAYIETTVPNFYYDFRPDPEIVARRGWTRGWWATAADRYELWTSDVVVDELSAGTSQFVPPRLELLRPIPVLSVTPAVTVCAQTYIRHKLMPSNPGTDAFHLALASHSNCDFIVTWNCKHLANPNKALHIHKINQRLGLRTPEIVTPLTLLRRMP
jgi:predicted nucleic acid-binding protein